MDTTRLLYHGHAMFEIHTSAGKKIIIDPYDEQIKSRLPEVSGNVVISSHDHFDHANISLVKGNPVAISKPGKFKVDGIEIEGLRSFHDTQKGKLRGENIIFKILTDNIVFAHLGDLGHIPDEATFKKLELIDILMIPVGGIYTVDAGDAIAIAKRVNPSVVIPMHYKEDDSKLEVDKVDDFITGWGTVKKAGHSVDITVNNLPESTEAWVMKSI